MDDRGTDLLSITRHKGSDQRKAPGRLAELVSITLDMLLIGSVSWGACALAGMKDHVALAAMGIAVYISGKHFNIMRREIVELREHVVQATSLSRRMSVDPSAPDRCRNGPDGKVMHVSRVSAR